MESLPTSPGDFSDCCTPGKLLSSFQASLSPWNLPWYLAKETMDHYLLYMSIILDNILLSRSLAANFGSPALNNLSYKLEFIHSCHQTARWVGLMMTETGVLEQIRNSPSNNHLQEGRNYRHWLPQVCIHTRKRLEGKGSFSLILVKTFQRKHFGCLAWSMCVSL